jgi:hypothetical protein
MIFAVAIAALALAAPEAPEARTYSLDAPAAAGFYRIAPSKAISDAWAIERFASAIVFDADGRRVACERPMREAPILSTTARHAVRGHWLSADELATLAPIGGFAFDRVWAFDPPVLADGEKNVDVGIEWHTPLTRSTAGELQVAPNDPTRDFSGGNPRFRLVDLVQRDGTTESRVPVGRLSTRGELRFRGASAIEIDRAAIDTRITRPWARAPVDWPGWIVFRGDGRPPYRLQLSHDGANCEGIGQMPSDADAVDPDWPTAATVGAEIAGVSRLPGYKDDMEKLTSDIARREWTRWSILVAFLFVIGCAFAIASDRRQRGDV